MQPVVQPGVRQQFVVGATLCDTAVTQYKDAVGKAYSGEAVCDDKRGTAEQKAGEAFLDETFGLCVHGRSSFVQNQNR